MQLAVSQSVCKLAKRLRQHPLTMRPTARFSVARILGAYHMYVILMVILSIGGPIMAQPGAFLSPFQDHSVPREKYVLHVHDRSTNRMGTLPAAWGSTCRYSGYIHSLEHSIAKTPIYAQEETMAPPKNTFVYERTTKPVWTPARDPCNSPDTYKKGLPLGQSVNLWPNLQPDPRPNFTEKDKPASTRPQEVHVVHGDRRIRVRPAYGTGPRDMMSSLSSLFQGHTWHHYLQTCLLVPISCFHTLHIL